MAVTINASTSSGLITSADNSGSLQFQTNGTATATINTSGNVGIGTTSPTNFGSNFKMLAVQGTDYGVIQGISNSSSTTIEMMAAGSIGYLGTRTNHPLALRTNDTERMRIDSSGNVFIGTTGTPGKFTVVAGNDVASDISNTNTNDVLALWGNKGNSSSSAMYIIPIRSGDATLRGSIYWTGSTIQYNTSSDYRLKENIAPMTGALAKVLQLKPVTYTWKESGFDGQGFIAHELAEVVPDCVTGEKDAVDAEGNPKYQGIDTSFLVATLTAAIQEQQTIINDLKTRITALEAK